MSKIAVIDYDAGNTMSVMNALKYLGYDVELSKDPAVLYKADHVVFPGVGAYADAMGKLNEYGLIGPIKEITGKKTPFLGVCLGMQLLFEHSSENIGETDKERIEGLGLLPGSILGFKENASFDHTLKVPHMGWNSLELTNKESKLFKGIDNGSFVYFVHSFYLNAANRSDVAAITEYGITFDSAVEHENIFGCQFHPEKSGDIGMEILKNFCSI
ncbi:MAG: imidazole glycerol phosphate synthase subunit HisH [Lachnospiraceae bacterium]|nr:imidazole glycerol phosphate synthase subunit HisH [Lachnospiraceae bacterium]MBR6468756.1 imidazole glycerol phosphate synthase subunit HisH [Lachnospiraceae bacterium]